MGTRLKIVLNIMAGAIVLAFVAGWYVLHNPDRYIQKITTYFDQITGLQMQFRHIEIHVFPNLLVRVYGLEIKNPKPFPDGDFMKVPELDATFEKIPLLHGHIAIQSLILDKPEFDFISDPDGLWNFQDASAAEKAQAHFSKTMVSSLQIKNGVLHGSNLIEPTDASGPIIVEIDNFSTQLNQIQSRPPSRSGSALLITGNLTADVARFGSIRTQKLQSKLRITSEQLSFMDFETKTYRGQASGNFSFNFGGKNATFETKLRVNGIGMPYVLSEFQKGPPKMTGVIQADLSLAGEITHTSHPLESIHGRAHVTIRNGELPNLDRNASMIEMERFRAPDTGVLPASAFSTFAGDMELRNNRIYSKRIDVDFYGTNVGGAGSTSIVNGDLDYRGVATVVKPQGFVTSLFARLFKEAQEKNGKLTFPLRITGTLTHPQCSVTE